MGWGEGSRAAGKRSARCAASRTPLPTPGRRCACTSHSAASIAHARPKTAHMVPPLRSETRSRLCSTRPQHAPPRASPRPRRASHQSPAQPAPPGCPPRRPRRRWAPWARRRPTSCRGRGQWGWGRRRQTGRIMEGGLGPTSLPPHPIPIPAPSPPPSLLLTHPAPTRTRTPPPTHTHHGASSVSSSRSSSSTSTPSNAALAARSWGATARQGGWRVGGVGECRLFGRHGWAELQGSHSGRGAAAPGSCRAVALGSSHWLCAAGGPHDARASP